MPVYADPLCSGYWLRLAAPLIKNDWRRLPGEAIENEDNELPRRKRSLGLIEIFHSASTWRIRA
jgi:hypothetical protein